MICSTDVYAAGDATQFRPKQGGLAAQQADAVAAAIATDLGADTEPMPFRPVLRGLLLTGLTPRYLRSDPASGSSLVDTEPLWSPPAKIVGRYLAPFLATQLGEARRSPRRPARAPSRSRSSSIRTAARPGRRSDNDRELTGENTETARGRSPWS
jgi:sulfide:quinone oxidoreductase